MDKRDKCSAFLLIFFNSNSKKNGHSLARVITSISNNNDHYLVVADAILPLFDRWWYQIVVISVGSTIDWMFGSTQLSEQFGDKFV